jgi:signal transduction histidine kinase
MDDARARAEISDDGQGFDMRKISTTPGHGLPQQVRAARWAAM